MIALGLDFENAFPSLEWAAIDASTRRRVPQLAPWTSWCHSQPSAARLPSGVHISSDRGAEQGDPLGPLQCALVLGDVMAAVFAAFGTDAASRLRGAWFVDDGQVFC